MANADWDSKWVGKGWRKLIPQRFRYGVLQGWERDIFLMLAECLPERGTVLSVGCGRALVDYWLAAVWGAEVHLLDLSACLLVKVHRSFGRVAHQVHVGDALKLPYGDNRFDVVWNEGVWEHFQDNEIYQGISEMARVSRDYVVVDVPYAECRPYVLAKQWLEQNGKWIYGLEVPKSSLRPYFDAAGLEFIEERPIGSECSCWNYINMVSDPSARQKIVDQLTPEDFQIYPHIVAIGRCRNEG